MQLNSEAINRALQKPLKKIRKRILEETILKDSPDFQAQISTNNRDLQDPDSAVIGAKVWMMPRSYYDHLQSNHVTRLALIDYVGQVMPSKGQNLTCVAELPCANIPQSEIEWTVGKGFLSHVLFAEDFGPRVLVHHSDFPHGIDSMSDAEYDRLARRDRLGRSRQDMKSLRDRYGSSIFVPFKPRRELPPIGCYTFHTPRALPIDKKTGRQISKIMHNSRNRVMKTILEYMHEFPTQG